MSENLYERTVTIDGPSGSGKGTIAVRLADYLGWHYLDSGSHFRALGYLALKNNIASDDVPSLLECLHGLQLTCEFGSQKEPIFKLFGQDISSEIRSEECSAISSKIAIHQEVRQLIVNLQREYLTPPGLVTDGRDMGTVVFPEAKFKVYLHASPNVAASRRYNQLKMGGINVSLDGVLSKMRQRDVRDSSRKVAPLRVASDAYFLDTDNLSVDEVFQKILGFVEDKGDP
ncbi:MAG: (d)CMP kinase [Legionellales bacterium]|nr:(d)CMP kinase [Legionellales bacterium]